MEKAPYDGGNEFGKACQHSVHKNTLGFFFISLLVYLFRMVGVWKTCQILLLITVSFVHKTYLSVSCLPTDETKKHI